MKKLLTIVFVISAIASEGQSKLVSKNIDSLVNNLMLKGTSSGTSGLLPFTLVTMDSIYQDRIIIDTIPCIMLVVDTVARMSTTMFFVYPVYPVDKAANEGWHSFVIRGYRINRSNTYMSTYIDADKKPLPKNIVVWMAKKI